MSERNEEYFRQRAGIAWLWTGVLAGPVAVALNQQLAYLAVTLTCSYGKTTVLFPVILLNAALVAGGAFVSWRNWRQAGGGIPDKSDDRMSRSRFMAIIGLLFSGLSSLAIVAMWLPTIFYRECQR